MSYSKYFETKWQKGGAGLVLLAAFALLVPAVSFFAWGLVLVLGAFLYVTSAAWKTASLVIVLVAVAALAIPSVNTVLWLGLAALGLLLIFRAPK